MKGGTSDDKREEYLSSFGLLVISSCGVILALPSRPAPTMSNPPRGAKAKQAKVELERAIVSNKAWSPRKVFFVGWCRLGCWCEHQDLLDHLSHGERGVMVERNTEQNSGC